MTCIHLKIPNSCAFAFLNRHLFGQYRPFYSIDTFSVKKHIFIQYEFFWVNRHILLYPILNGYDFSIDTFWYIKFEGL